VVPFLRAELLVDVAAAGLGIAQVFDLMVEQPVRDGRLVTILRDYESPGPDIHAVCLPQRKNSPKVRLFFDLIEQTLGLRHARSRREQRLLLREVQ
jgi:DNA-binding transcriptional LysR family regulator